jgi:hypothetical protein
MPLRILAIIGMTLVGSIAPQITALAQASPATASAAPSSATSQTVSAAVRPEHSNAPTMIAAQSGDPTIVVAVSDSASIAVEQVQMKYSLYDSGYYDYDTSLYVEPVKLPADEIEAAVMAALDQAGIPAGDIDLSYAEMGMYGSNEVSVIVTLPASHTAIRNVTEAVMSVSSQFTNLTAQTVGVRLGTSRCDVVAGEARLKTIELARERAAIIAEAIGVTLGEVTNVYESYQDLMPYSAATCLEASGDFPSVRLSSYGGEWTMYMESAPLEIELSTTLEVTFSAE